jgi:hypothetical protein
MPLEDLTEATPDTTTDEIKAYAESVVQEIVQDRKGEPEKKSDAQITSEQAGTPQPSHKPKETPAENKSGSDTALDESEETGDVEESPKWLTDDVRAEAAAYGIEEAEIADFASREELDRALRLFDKTALEVGRKAMAESEGDTTRNEKGQFVKKETPKADPPKEETPKDGRYQVSLSKDLYDEEIIDEFNRLRDHYESRFEALESHFAEANAIAEEQRFDSFVDALGHTDLFGVTGKESDKELERRRDLIVAVKAQMIGLERLGRPTEMSQQLISRVANMAFATELGKKLLKQQTRKISKQSDGRQGGSPTKPLPPRDNPRDEADRLYKELSRS